MMQGIEHDEVRLVFTSEIPVQLVCSCVVLIPAKLTCFVSESYCILNHLQNMIRFERIMTNESVYDVSTEEIVNIIIITKQTFSIPKYLTELYICLPFQRVIYISHPRQIFLMCKPTSELLKYI